MSLLFGPIAESQKFQFITKIYFEVLGPKMKKIYLTKKIEGSYILNDEERSKLQLM